jgi:hypothetical protein
MIVPFNICQGPAEVYAGVFGTTEPADSAVGSGPPGAGWTDVGGIADGTSVLLETDLTYTDQGVDQLPMPVGARLTKQMVQLTFAMEEATLQNMQLAMNNLGVLATQEGYSTWDPIVTSSASQPQYTALIVDGWAPTLPTGQECRRRIILRKALSASKIALEYEKSKTVVYNTTWTGYWISDSLAPYHIADAN